MLVLYILFGISVAFAGCFDSDGTDSLYCCSTSDSISFDSSAATACSDATCATGTTVVNNGNDYVEYEFDAIFIGDGVSVSMSGSRAIRLVSKSSITVDGGVFNATALPTSISLSASYGTDCGYRKFDSGHNRDCKETSHVPLTRAIQCNGETYETFHVGRLGGFNGYRASGYSSYTQIQAIMSVTRPPKAAPHGRSLPTTVSGAQSSNMQFGADHDSSHAFGVVGGGGSFGGKGSRDLNAPHGGDAGDTYGSATMDLVGGGGGGGGAGGWYSIRTSYERISHAGQFSSLTDYCKPAHGGAGGGAIELEAQGGDIVLGDTEFVTDGAGNYFGGVGGAGAGGMLRFQVKSGYDVIVTKQARLRARGGYSTPASGNEWTSTSHNRPLTNGRESVGGGGRIIFRKYDSGTAASKTYVVESTSLSVQSGSYRCGTSCSCDLGGKSCGDTDGVISYSGLSKVTASVPDNADNVAFSSDAVCRNPKTITVSPSSDLDRAGGQTVDITLSAPMGSSSLDIDTTGTVTATIGTASATSCSVESYTGSSASSADTVIVECTTPAGTATGLDVQVTMDGRTFTRASAVSYRQHSVTSWASTQPAARRWANATEDKLDDALQYNISITGQGFNTTETAVAAVGGRPCVSTIANSDTSITCVVPDGIGTGHAVQVKVGQLTESGGGSFSYAAPEIHAVSLPSGHNATTGDGWDAAGGQTLTIRGLNFGSTKWATNQAVAVAGGTDVTVTVGGTACTSVTVVSDRKITCTTPAGNGPVGHVSVTVGGQTASTSIDGSEDSRAHLASVDTQADDDWHNKGLSSASWVQAGHLVSVYNVSAPALSSVTFGATTRSAGASQAIVLPADGSSKTLTIAGTDFGTTGSKPAVYLGNSLVPASSVTRTSDTALSVSLPAGVGAPRLLSIGTGYAGLEAKGVVRVGYQAPSLSSATIVETTTRLSQAGGTSVKIIGTNFGGSPASVSVSIGGSACTSISLQSSTDLVCVTPAGIGLDLGITVNVGGQSASLSTSLGYTVPAIASVQPTELQLGSQLGSEAVLNITGTGFGSSAPLAAPVLGKLGTVPCMSTHWLSSTKLSCRVNATRLSTGRWNVGVTLSNTTATTSADVRVFGAPVVVAARSTSGNLRTGSSSTVSIDGTFAKRTSDIKRVTVGRFNCTSPELYDMALPQGQSSQTIQCQLSGGGGANLAVAVETTGGLKGSTDSLISFQRPAVLRTVPAEAPLSGVFDMTLFGSGLGSESLGLQPSAVSLGGRPCLDIVFFNSSAVQCRGVNASLGFSSGSIVVTVEGQTATSSVFRVKDGPSITGAVPEVGSVDGGYTLSIVGQNLGVQDSDIYYVRIGGRECTGVTRDPGATWVNCTVPAGVGARPSVDLRIRTITYGGEGLFGYLAPAISAVSPGYALAGVRDVAFTVVGSNLGTIMDLPTSVEVGGINCNELVVINSSAVNCTVRAPAGDWLSSAARLQVGGQSALTGGVFQGFGEPFIGGALPRSVDVKGGQTIRLFGGNFGQKDADISSLLIGGRACTDVRVYSPTEITCVSPQGVGKSVSVQLRQSAGLSFTSDQLLGYKAPVIARIEPSHVLSGDVSYNMTVFGEHFGNDIDAPSQVIIGGRVCPTVRLLNSTALKCIQMSGKQSWSSSLVQVRTGSQDGSSSAVLRVFGVPTLRAATTTERGTAGGYSVAVSGSNFGTGLEDVDRVMIGARRCEGVAFESSGRVTCTAPPGAGKSLPVRFYSSVGTESLGQVLYSYDAPVLLALEPDYVLTGPANYTFTIRGYNLAVPAHLGDSAVAPEGLSLGGALCTRVTVVNDTEVVCHDVSARSWQGSAVEISLRGQASLSQSLLEVVQVPRVTGASPAVISTAGGANVTVYGVAFGRKVGDVASVSIGGRPCEPLWHLSGSQLKCTAPAGTGRSADVVVTNRLGLRSEAAPLVGYEAPRVSTVQPDYVLSGPEDGTTLDVYITGDSIASGNQSDQMPEIQVAGVNCAAVERTSSDEVWCRGLDPSQWSSADVKVSLDGQSTTSTGTFTFVGQPQVLSVSLQRALYRGGQRVTIIGTNFGRVADDVSVVKIGRYDCEDLDASQVLQDRLFCITPEGSGAGLNVQVVNALGLASEPNTLFSYEDPVISSTDPAYVFQPAAGVEAADLRVRLRGSSFGQQTEDLETITVGGQPCVYPTWISSESAVCTVPGANLTAFSSDAVELELAGGQTSVVEVLRIYGQPRISLVNPGIGAVLGGDVYTVVCADCGEQPGDVLEVSIGGNPCLNFTVAAADTPGQPLTIECVAPPGAGGLLSVEVTTRGGMRTPANALFSYSQPSVRAIEPAQVLSGSVDYNFTVTGTELGMQDGDVDWIEIGGKRCTSASWISPTQARCVGASAPWFSNAIVVSVAGQRSRSAGLLRPIAQPQVTSVTSDAPGGVNAVDGGYKINVTGRAFGVRPGDVSSVWFGDTREASLRWISDELLEVGVPPGAGQSLKLVVERRDGLLSTGGVFSYAMPAVSRVDPAFLVPGVGDVTVSVLGSHLAQSLDDITAVRVGGYACTDLAVVSSGELRCALSGVGDWPAEGVEVSTPYSAPLYFESAFEGFASPRVDSLSPDLGAAAGGTNVTVRGDFFAAVDQDGPYVTGVSFGGVPCPSFRVIDRNTITVLTPPGVGSQLSVYVHARGGYDSESRRLWRYSRPSIAYVDPPTVFLGEAQLEFTIEGASFGTNVSKLEAVGLVANRQSGGKVSLACTNAALRSSGRITCNVEALNATELSGGQYNMRVTVAGQSSIGTTSSAVVAIGTPTVTFVTPALGSVQGGSIVTIKGTNFGEKPDDVIFVVFGGKVVPQVGYVDSTTLVVTAPRGAGSSLSVDVLTRGGLRSPPNGVFSYLAPIVSTLEPSYAFMGDIKSDFIVQGSELGSGPEDIDAVTVGGNPCESIYWISSSKVRCVGVNSSSWDNSEVVLVAKGQRSQENELLDVLADPVVAAVSPNIAGPGESILVFGENFGFNETEVEGVYVDGRPCTSVVWQDSSAVECFVPEPWPYKANDTDSRVLLRLSIDVITRGGQRSAPNQRFAYKGAGSTPFNAPTDVVGYRRIGQSTSIVLRWLYSDQELNGDEAREFYENADAFLIQYLDSGTEEGGWAKNNVVEQRVLRTSVTALPLDPERGINEMTYTLVGFERKPYWFRVRAENTAGLGPVSAPSNMVTEACHAGQFLQTHRNRSSDITCAACPPGAYCAGLPHSNVTALQGYWRVPWAESGLVFQECPETESCFGVELDEQGQAVFEEAIIEAEQAGAEDLYAANSSGNATDSAVRRLSPAADADNGRGTSIRFRVLQQQSPGAEVEDPEVLAAARLARMSMRAEDFFEQAIPDLVLNAPEIEGCEDGHAGKLCTTCAQGFTRTGNFRCRRCASRSFILVVMVLVVLLMMAIVAFVIRRTLMTKEREGRIEVMIMKIGVSHLQTIALASTFDLQWPGNAMRFFDTVDTASSVSPNVVSVDCLVDRGSEIGERTFYLKTGMVLLAPLFFVGGIALFWVARYGLQRWFASSKQEQIIRSMSSAPGTGTGQGSSGRASPGAAIASTSPLFGGKGYAAAAADRGSTASIDIESRGAVEQYSESKESPVRSAASPLRGKKAGSANATAAGASAASVRRQGAGAASGFSSMNPLAMRQFGPGSSAGSAVLGGSPVRGGRRATIGPMAMSSASDDIKRAQAVRRILDLQRKETTAKITVGEAASSAGRSGPGKRNRKRRMTIRDIHSQVMEKENLSDVGISAVDLADIQVRATQVSAKSSTWAHTTERMLVSCIVVGFLIHATVSKAALRLFTCIEIGGAVDSDGTAVQSGEEGAGAVDEAETRSVLLYDMDVDCDSRLSFAAKFFVGLPFFLVYSIGIPVAAGLLMWFMRDHLDDPVFGRRFYFLFAGFRTEAAYWESVVALRKVGIAVISVFLRPEGIDVQTYCALLLVFASGVLHSRVWPYQQAMLNLLELGCLCTQFMTLYCGLYLLSPSVGQAGKEAATACLLVANIVALIGIAVCLFYNVLKKAARAFFENVGCECCSVCGGKRADAIAKARRGKNLLKKASSRKLKKLQNLPTTGPAPIRV